jgi:MFS family permease
LNGITNLENLDVYHPNEGILPVDCLLYFVCFHHFFFPNLPSTMSSTLAITEFVQIEKPPECRIESDSQHKPEWDIHTAIPTDQDAIMAASRIADAEVSDGGYGWVLVLACGLVTWWCVGITYSWGVIQEALVAEGLSSVSTLSFVGSVMISFNAIFAMPSASVIRWLGTRNTALLGIFLLGFGNILSGFTASAKSVGGLFATTSIITGLGVSTSYMVASTLPAQYFNRKRGLANGLVCAAGGLGGAVISLIMDALISRLGVPWSFRIIGLLTWGVGFPAAWLLRERVPLLRRSFIEWRLFRDPQFLLLFLAGFVGTFPLFVPPFFLPLYSKSLGFSSKTGAGLVAGFNFSSAVGRVLCGFLCDRIGPLNTLFGALFTGALSTLALWPISQSLAPLAVFVVVNGMANGGFFATMPTVISNIFGSARVGVAMSMIVTSWAGGYLMGAPIAGYLLKGHGGENRGSKPYQPAMFYAGGMFLGASALVLVARFRASKSIKKRL